MKLWPQERRGGKPELPQNSIVPHSPSDDLQPRNAAQLESALEPAAALGSDANPWLAKRRQRQQRHAQPRLRQVDEGS